MTMCSRLTYYIHWPIILGENWAEFKLNNLNLSLVNPIRPMGAGGFKVPGSNSFCDLYIFLVGHMPLTFFTFLKLPLWSSRKKPEHSIFLGLIVAARQSSRTPFSNK